MIRKLYQLLSRVERLRNAQWFYKSVPRQFILLPSGGATCPACGTPATHGGDYPSRVRPFAGRTVQFCTTCGLGFVEDMRNLLADYYDNDYAEVNRRDRDLPPDAYFDSLDDGSDPALEKYARRGQEQMALLSKFGASFERVLDYGSGPGYFLHLCGPQTAHAVEPDPHSEKYLENLGATIHSDHRTVPDDLFDTIVASHTIEHLPPEDLMVVLRKLLRALAPDGRLLIEVPQGGHSHLYLAGERQDPHTLFFTGQALVTAVQRAGGTILYQKARGRIANPQRDDAIYTPSGVPFFTTARGSLTVICTRAF